MCVDGLIYDEQIIPLNNYKFIVPGQYAYCECLDYDHHNEEIEAEMENCGEYELWQKLKEFEFTNKPCKYPYSLSIKPIPFNKNGKNWRIHRNYSYCRWV